MKAKTIGLIGTVVVLVAAFLVVRSYAARIAIVPNSVTLPANTVRVEGDTWAGYAYFRSPTFLQGSNIDYKYDTELDQAARAAKMTEGKTNFIVTTMDQVLANKPPGRIVGIIDESMGADALVLNTKKHPYLTTVDGIPRLVEDMKQQGTKPTLAYTGNSPSEFLMRKLANTQEELRLSDFTLVSVDQSPTAYKMLQENKADVAVLWEPDTTAAAKEGFTVALSSKDVPHSIVDVLVASDYVIQHNPDVVQQVENALYQARRQAVADPNTFAAFIAKDGGMEGDQAAILLRGIHLFDAAEANQFINQRVPPLDETKAFEALETIGGLLNLSDPSIVPDPLLIDGRFVARSASSP